MILFKDFFLPGFHLWLVKTCYSNIRMKRSKCLLLKSLHVIPSIQPLDISSSRRFSQCKYSKNNSSEVHLPKGHAIQLKPHLKYKRA